MHQQFIVIRRLLCALQYHFIYMMCCPEIQRNLATCSLIVALQIARSLPFLTKILQKLINDVRLNRTKCGQLDPTISCITSSRTHSQ